MSEREREKRDQHETVIVGGKEKNTEINTGLARHPIAIH